MVNVLEDGDRIILSLQDMRVLSALLLGPMNAYEIARQIESDRDATSDDRRISYGAVSYSLKRLEQCLFIDKVVHSHPDKLKRQNYRIASSGRMVLSWHMAQLHIMVKLAEERMRRERLT